MRVKAIVLILLTAFLGCSKDNTNNTIVLSNNLTNCPTCIFNYYDNADFSAPQQPVAGNFRVFAYSSTNTFNNCGPGTQIYFKTSLSNSEFDIKTNEIATGQSVKYLSSCPCCDYAFYPLKPIGGEIKGKRTDATHWLVNVSIVLGSSFDHPSDTVVVNQYFTLAKLP